MFLWIFYIINDREVIFMAFISFTGNIGNDSDIFYNEKKQEETHYH